VGIRGRALLVLLALLSPQVPSHAQTVYGPGGLFIHPSALTPPKGSVGLNVSFYTETKTGGGHEEWLPVSLAYAASDRAQVGALFIDRRAGGSHRESGGIFAKYQLVPDGPRHPALALTGSYLGGDVKQWSLSGVASHRFTSGSRTSLIGHAGLQWVRRTDDIQPEGDLAAFVGAEIPLTTRLSLLGEYGTKLSFNPEPASSIGLQWSSPGGISVGIAYLNTGRSSDNRFFVGVGYPIGGGRSGRR
jgi:hypothetical protein